MTRKHFIELAKIIKDSASYITDNKRLTLAERVADYCSTQNHLFDRDRFIQACGFDDRKCHLCDTLTVNKYCINDSCAEYTRYEQEH